MAVSTGINFDEPIPQMIERLKSEHVIFESKLVQVEDNLKNNNVKQAKAKNESSESIKIMQEHNWVVKFLKSNLLFFERARSHNSSLSSDSKDFKDAKKNINEFVINLRKHFEEEEQIVFPLTLRAEATN
ncbi:MAG: hemerythrin domain-containing protein [Nitrososphaeraceae archaeon]